MATQNYTISSHSHAAENAAFTLVEEKNKRKQQKELAHLNTVLNLLEEEIAQAETGGADYGTEVQGKEEKKSGKIVELKEAAPKKSFEDSMAEMALALQLLQVQIAKSSNDKSKLDYQIAQAQVKVAEANLENVKSQIAKMVAQEKKQAAESFWMKLFTVVVAVVIDIVAVCTLNPATAAILIAISTTMLVLSLSGALDKATQGIAKLLVKCGMSEKAAHTVAAIIVVALVIVLSLAAGPEGVAEGAAEGAEAGIEAGGAAAEEAADQAAEEASSLVEQLLQGAKTVGNGVKSGFKGLVKIFKIFPPRVNLAIVAGLQALQQTGLSTDIAKGLASLDPDKKERQKIEEVIEIMIALLSAIASIGAGGAMMEGISAGSEASELGELGEDANSLQKLRNGIVNFVRSSGGNLTATGIELSGEGAKGATGIALGVTMAKQGELETVLGELSASLQLIQAAQNNSSSQTKADQKHEADALKSQKTGDQSLSKLMAGEAAFANIFTANSPV